MQQRNALTCKPDGLVLGAGALGTVIDTFDNDAFLVEFGSRGPNECDWLGVLYASELQLAATNSGPGQGSVVRAGRFLL